MPDTTRPGNSAAIWLTVSGPRSSGCATWISGVVLELVAEGSLILSWLEEGGEWVHPARLVFTLAPTAAGTRVTLAHDGFAGIGKPGWAGTVQGYERGADRHRILERLAALAAADAAADASA